MTKQRPTTTIPRCRGCGWPCHQGSLGCSQKLAKENEASGNESTLASWMYLTSLSKLLNFNVYNRIQAVSILNCGCCSHLYTQDTYATKWTNHPAAPLGSL